MKLLLTSGGVTTRSIEDALVELLGRPVAEASALCITTASYAMSNGAQMAWRFLTGSDGTPLTGLGWKSLGVLELTALASAGPDVWVPTVRNTDAILVNGGDPMYLCHWLRESGLAEVLPSLDNTVWVGISAGSMVLTPSIGEDFVEWRAPDGTDRTLGVVDFAIFPHLDHPQLPENTMSDAERWAADMPVPAYAIDDATAITVVGDEVRVVSEGHWRFFGA